MNHGLSLKDKTLEIILPDGTEVEQVIVDGKEFVRKEEEEDGEFKPTF